MSESPAPASRVQRVRHEIKRRELTVARVEDITPHFRSVTFTGESLADFVSASFDDHVKFILGAASESPVMRDYTPRRYDREARELTIEFALHGDGPAADWAASVKPGQTATIAGPRGSFVIPLDYEWHLLAGDETALPAIARRLEELPAGAKVTVIAQADVADRRQFASEAAVDVTWVDTPEALLAAVRSLELPKGDGYAWCAGESKVMAELRRVLVQEKGHDGKAIRAAAYWKQGAAAHHENLEG
jgi:NADPH-dependent ferric siderophore reductase